MVRYRNLLVAFLVKIDRVVCFIILAVGCDQMACAHLKEVSHLRIFRPKGLLVTFEMEVGFGFIFLVEMIADGWVRKVEVVVWELDLLVELKLLMRARVTL